MVHILLPLMSVVAAVSIVCALRFFKQAVQTYSQNQPYIWSIVWGIVFVSLALSMAYLAAIFWVWSLPGY
jgi:hypothetical protein